ncbi:cyclophilin-like fold protein [Collinsella sp. An2]|uniref:cyclophilin-like fold protein n=1 Tax=Collinsella sp. An2 TaxID=1965585 RepID=UPI000B3662D3|nr:cyclophilin-like fold protein [Collinsella sp. An2]OUP10847.1 hypothetical protein B5F33_00170 [Collinsella sp. An2]
MRVTMEFDAVAVPVELNDSPAAQALLQHLPLRLSMNGSSVGCCGQLPFALPHDAAQLHDGWADGDLNYKPAGDWLALFFDDEENSARYGGQVTLGHVTGPLGPLRDLAGEHAARIVATGEDGVAGASAREGVHVSVEAPASG